MKKFIFGVIGIIVAVALVVVLFLYVLFPVRFKQEITDNCTEFGLSQSMVASIINIESGFDNDVVSSAGAIGIMQILPSTAMECAEKLGIDFVQEDLFDYKINMRIGCFYLSYLLELFKGNITNMLCAYNWGLGNVKNWLESGNIDSGGTITNIPVKETRDYINKFALNEFVYSKIYKY